MRNSRSPKTNLFLLSLAIPSLAVLLPACGAEMENGSEKIESVELAISSIAPPMQTGKTFWGTGGLKEFRAITASDCYTPCFNDAACSGGTFNPDKQYCWLRTGSGTVGAGLVSDSAFTMPSDLRNSYFQPLLSSGQTFWGTGGVREFSTPNAADCYLACVSEASCTGGTFNPAKQYCWLRGGGGSAGAGLPSDYAFRMTPDMSDINTVVQRYSPVVVLHPSETYMPDNVQHYLQNVELHAGLLLSGEADSDYDTFNLLHLASYSTLPQGLTQSASSLRSTVNDYVTSSSHFRWSPSGPIAGMTCTQITEGADPYTWNDNYFCNDLGITFSWSSSGPIAGKKTCIQVNEPADPHTWNDNYLCHDSAVEFQWSYGGPISGMNCTNWSEGADPHGWNDNYLCNKPLSNYTKVWTQIPADKDSLKNGDVVAAKSYVALEQAAGSNELKIQYWYFYPYNGPGRVEICASGNLCNNYQLPNVGRHEGDWEHVDVVVNTQTGSVVSLFLSQHGGGRTIGTNELQSSIGWLGGRHPVVYSGYYSHAFYANAGRQEYERAWNYDYWIGTASVDLYDLTGEGTRFSAYSPAQFQVVAANVPGLQVTKPEWASFSDRWGKYERNQVTFVIDYGVGTYNYTQKMIGTGPYKSF
ncbi:Vps62-related protein [Hyalangium versicolor]|uniref:Vps62-related protein n=1 Tax=Hyalangium versicolor TaxID=2861190 RepID=UPI001CCDA56A|nr:Vps62-related protein [Hyalangium versicolor]